MTIRTGLPGFPRVSGAPARGTGNGTASRSPHAVPRRRLRTPGDDQGPWVDRALCRESDPDLFFPVATSNRLQSQRQIAAAQAVCGRCPVIESCRNWALAYPRLAEFGVWGGLTEGERRSVVRQVSRESSRAERVAA